MSKRRKDFQPHWRPNFVDAASLPDIKIVRTHFIINIVAVSLLMASLAFLIFREYRISSINTIIAEISQQVADATPENNAALKLSADFRKAAENVAEVETFYLSPFLAHDFLFNLSELRPDDLVFTEISFRENASKAGVGYNISISGEVRYLTTLDEFKGIIGQWDMLAIEGYNLSVDEVVEGRNDTTGIFPYRLNIALTP